MVLHRKWTPLNHWVTWAFEFPLSFKLPWVEVYLNCNHQSKIWSVNAVRTKANHHQPWKLTFLDSFLDTRSLLAKQFPMYFISYLYRLNVCVPPKFISWNLTPKVMISESGAFGSWLGHEDGALMNRITSCSFIKETPQSSLAPSTKWGHWEGTFYKPKSGFSPDTEPCASQPPEVWEIMFLFAV